MKCKCVRPWMSANITPTDIAVCCFQEIERLDTNKYTNIKDAMLTDYRDFRIAMLESSKENKIPEKYCKSHCEMALSIDDLTNAEVKKEIEAGNVDYFVPLELTLITDLVCNLKCKMCYIQQIVDTTSKISREFVTSMIDDMKEHDDSELIILGGELQYSKFGKEILMSVIDANIKISIISNFTIFDQDIFDNIYNNKLKCTKISANAATTETRKLIMGDSFNKFIVNVEKFLHWKHKYQEADNEFYVTISFVIMTSNYHEIIDAIDFYLKYPVYLNFATYHYDFDGKYEEVYTLKTHQDAVLSELLKATEYVNQLIDAKNFIDTDIPCQMDVEEFRMNQLKFIKRDLLFNINCLKDIMINKPNFDKALFDIDVNNKTSFRHYLK